MHPAAAAVYYRDQMAGVLRRTAAGFEYGYDATYLADPGAVPISRSLPLCAERFESRDLFPFFDGLLPEGWLLAVTCAVAKIDEHDKFRLLVHTGADPVGAVSVRPLEGRDGA